MLTLIARNTLLSSESLHKIINMGREEDLYGSFQDLLVKFQDIKKFASEIHTEIHLIRPTIKLLGYTYESKPKFFEEQVKGPDAALFAPQEGSSPTSSLWGTEEYYARTLGILLVKRYGRNLEEGITGFYLEFENRIPLYQAFYLLKKTRTPWAILTNGKHWILLKRPIAYEMRLLSIDLESGLFDQNKETIHLFYHIFSFQGLTQTLPALLEEERTALIDTLKQNKIKVHNTMHELRKKMEIFPKAIEAYRDIYPEKHLRVTEQYLAENNVAVESADSRQKQGGVSEYAASEISSYLFNRKGYQSRFDLEEVFLANGPRSYSKEQMLSLKILDMTPNFGNIASALVDTIAYLSFTLPYRERNTFIAEWEHDTALKRTIIENVLFGIEKSHVAYDILLDSLKTRYKTEARNYRLGNPLIGMALDDVSAHFDAGNQPGLFSRNPGEVIRDFKEMFKRYYSLSDKIREDLQVKSELEVHLKKYMGRLGDIMDLITSTYFAKTVDNKKIHDLLSNLDADETMWSRLKSQDWFASAKAIAGKNGFFHLELQFPFLLNSSFDYIFVQPALRHVWEDAFPVLEVTKAYIKRGMPYLKRDGYMVIILEEGMEDELMHEMSQSKRYTTELKQGLMMVTRKRKEQQTP